jgi:MFS family permease
MITLALGALALGLSQTESWGWIDVRTLACFTVTAVTIPLFVGRQRRHPEPVLDLTLFEHRSFRIANVGGLVFFAGFAALGLNNVLFLRQAWGYTVLHAGLLSALAPLTVALLAPISGRLASRHGFRPFLIVGPLLVTTGMVAYYVLLDGEPTPWLFVAIGELSAVGIAAFIPVNAAAAVSQLPPPRLSIGGAVSNTSRQVGSVVGVALLVAVLGAPVGHDALVAAHHRGFLVIAVAMITASVVSTGQPRLQRAPVRVDEPIEALLG